MLKWIIAAILLLPVAEIAAFIAVAGWIGLGWALLLALFTTFCGVWLLRRVGRDGLARFRGAVGRRTEFDVGADTFLSVLGGLLLALPGFITDLIGALMLIGPLRRRFVAVLGRRTGLRPQGRTGSTADDVVDLDPEEWRQVPERKLENPRRQTPGQENRNHDRPGRDAGPW